MGRDRRVTTPVLGLAVLLVAASGRATAADTPAPAAPQAAPLTAADWRADLEFARTELPRRHVNLFHTLAPAAYEASFDRLLADVDGLAGHQIVVRLAEIVAAVGDGHSRLTLPVDPAAGFFTGHTGTAAAHVEPFGHLPLRLARTAQGFFVVATDERLAGLLGWQVLDVDGRATADVETALAPVVQRDNDHQLHDLLPSFMVVPEVLHARGVTASVARSQWRFRGPTGRTRTEVLQPVARGVAVQWRHLPASGWPRAAQGGEPAGQPWFADIDRPAAVYARIPQIADTPALSFAAFADALQSHLATTSNRRLVLDLRGNPGGDNSLNAPLVRALIRTSWVSEPGALFVLVDGGTFSAAMNLALDLEAWLPAGFVGTGTGARPNSYGDARKLELPRSGLTVRLSSLYWQNHPKDERAAIEPLLPAEPTIELLRAARDPADEALAALDRVPATLSGSWRGHLVASFRHRPMELEIPDPESAGTVSIRELGVETAPVRFQERAGPSLSGVAAVRSGTLEIAARAGGDHLVGWIQYRGTRYPFVLSRAANP